MQNRRTATKKVSKKQNTFSPSNTPSPCLKDHLLSGGASCAHGALLFSSFGTIEVMHSPKDHDPSVTVVSHSPPTLLYSVCSVVPSTDSSSQCLRCLGGPGARRRSTPGRIGCSVARIRLQCIVSFDCVGRSWRRVGDTGLTLP
jgi:hypothetical protein